ncbi:MAG: 50S ribosomal protein L15 [Clostridiales bacterium]|jgi:large subunit ribosomal protein L15|nr:50S ribosomal protein L15 [Clostridiales bacterium]
MDIQTLSPAPGAKTKPKRIGRGIGSGMGKTSTKGHKGQWARSGGGVRPGFEGGQMPITRRLPKRGFTNIYKKEYTVVNVSDLEIFENGATVNLETLVGAGLVKKVEAYGIKVLGNGELTKKLTVEAKKFSKSAVDIIEKAGGKAEVK